MLQCVVACYRHRMKHLLSRNSNAYRVYRFMWIRAQVDYLRRLPNDAEKRQALGKLPPDLPQTYIRILETIDRSYRGQTLQYIQRLLKWIFYATEDNYFPSQHSSSRSTQSPSMEALCEAVCIEDKCVWPTREVVPTKDQILRWLGCLVRVDQQTNGLRFSHFSIKEFLRMDASTLPVSVARNYLVLPEDRFYLINTCLTYIMHSYFDNVLCTSWNDVKALCLEHPFWEHVGYKLICYILGHQTAEEDCGPSLRNFLATPPRPGFKLWAICETYSSRLELEERDSFRTPVLPRSLILNLPSPLHFASAAGLISQATRLLKEGTSPDATELLESQCVTPLHLAITGGYRHTHAVLGGITVGDDNVSDPECSLVLTELLVQYGADVNRQMLLKTRAGNDNSVLTPLTLALFRHNWRVANYLLVIGVDCKSRSRIKVKEDLLDLCSLKGYMNPYYAHERYEGWENEFRELVELSDHRGLREAFAECRYKRFRRDDDSQRTPSVQDLFISAFSSGRWDEVPKLINQHKSLNLDCVDEDGIGAVYLAAVCRDDMLSVLLEHQADPNLATGDDHTALHVAAQNGHVANIRLLLEKGARLDPRQSEGYTPLLMAVEADQQQAVQILLDYGADFNAKLDNGSGALHIALESKHTQLVTTLLGRLDRGIECFTPNNYGTTPLNLACGLGEKELVEDLIALSENVARDIDSDSVYHGTCLYTASRLGTTSIIKMLIHHGATINKTGPGNFLGSALMVACAHGQTGAVEMLLANGAALEVEGSRFKSASGTARAFRQDKVLKILEHHTRGMEGAKVEELGVDGQSFGFGEPKEESTVLSILHLPMFWTLRWLRRRSHQTAN